MREETPTATGCAVTRVAVLIPAHNRRDGTVRAITRVMAMASVPELAHWDVRIHLTDDGSTDGTSEAVRGLGLPVTIVSGPGDWFWARSVAEAWRSVDGRADLILLLNDDVVLADDALVRLDEWHRRLPDAVLVGQLRDTVTGAWERGGHRRVGRSPLRHRPVIAEDEPVDAEMFHGDAVLIPRSVAERVGPLDGGFSHGAADFDYGLRVVAAGYRNVVVPGCLGTIPANPKVRARSIRESLQFYEHRLGYPLADRKRLLRRHGGRTWPVQLALPYAAVLFGYRPTSRLPNPGSSSAESAPTTSEAAGR